MKFENLREILAKSIGKENNFLNISLRKFVLSCVLGKENPSSWKFYEEKPMCGFF